MAVELRNALGVELGSDGSLPATVVFDYPSVAALADFLMYDVLGVGSRTDSSSAQTTVDVTRNARIDAIEDLSDEEVEQLLAMRSRGR